MDRKLLQERIDANKPFSIATASGDRYVVESADYIHFSPSKTAVFVFWTDDEGDDRYAIVPLLTITAVEAKVDAA